MRQRPGMTLDQRRTAIGMPIGTSTTPCLPFSVLELAINKQGQLLTFQVQVGYVKRPQRRPVHRDVLQKTSLLDMSNDCCPSDECYTNSFFSIHVLKSPAVCRFEITSTVRCGCVNGTSSKAETELGKRTLSLV